MIELPTLGGDFSILEVVMAVAIYITGYVIHELCHIIPLWYWGYDYRVQVLPTKEGQSKLVALFLGTVVQIDGLEAIPRRHVVISALAPLVWALFPLYAMVLVLTHSVVDIGTGTVVALWFMVAIPSMRDWATVFLYNPETATVSTEIEA